MSQPTVNYQQIYNDHLEDNLKDYLEDIYGATVETSVGLQNEPVSVFDENGKIVAAFENTPDEAVLNFHFGALA